MKGAKQRIKRLLSEGYKLVCLPEEASLVVDEDKMFAVGAEIEIITKSKMKKLEPKQVIEL